MNTLKILTKQFLISKKYYLYFSSFWILFSITSCGNPPEHSKYIPLNTSFVSIVNINKIRAKADNWQEIFQSENTLWFSKDTTYRKLFRENWEGSGIDNEKVIYIFSDASQSEEPSFVAMSIKLENESDFDAFLRKTTNDEKEIKSFEGLKYVLLDNQSMIGWANQVALYLHHPKPTTEAKLKAELARLHDLPEKDALINQNIQFEELQETVKTSDIGVWMNLSNFDKPLWRIITQIIPDPYDFLLPKVDFNDNFIVSTINFDDGKIRADTEYFITHSLSFYQDKLKQNIDTNLIRSFPLERPMSVVGVGLDMENIQKAVKQYDVEDVFKKFFNLGNVFQDNTGYELNEILESFAGDFVIALDNIEERSFSRNDTDPETGETVIEKDYRVFYDYILAMGVGDVEVVQEVLDNLEKNEKLTKESNVYKFPIDESLTYYFYLKGNIFYVITSEKLKDLLISEDAQKISSDISNLGKGSWFISHSDVQGQTRLKLPPSIFSESQHTEKLIRSLDTPIKAFDTQITPIVDDKMTIKMEILFLDEEKNTLESLIEFFKKPQNFAS